VRKQKAPPPAEDDGPSKAWLDSYADAMTLLLAFFVLLYAFSLLDEKKFAEFKFGVEQAFSFSSPAVPEGTGFLDEGLGINENAGQLAVVPSDVQNEIDELLQELAADQQITPDEVEELREAVEAALASAAVDLELFQVETDPRGVVITLDESLLFASGSARIDERGAPALGAVAEVLADLDNQILVEGHTDSVPTTGSVWPTNWELSSARATAVLRELNESFGLAAPRLSAVGHADTRPRASNDTEEGRAQNRRTQIVVLVSPDSALISDVPLVDDIATSDGAFPDDPGELDGAAREVGADGETAAEGDPTAGDSDVIGQPGDPDFVEFDNPVFEGP
jgi:chemotaxis protein MotB